MCLIEKGIGMLGGEGLIWGAPSSSVCGHRQEVWDGAILQWLTVCGSAFLPMSPSRIFLPYISYPGHFLAQLDGQI